MLENIEIFKEAKKILEIKKKEYLENMIENNEEKMKEEKIISKKKKKIEKAKIVIEEMKKKCIINMISSLIGWALSFLILYMLNTIFLLPNLIIVAMLLEIAYFVNYYYSKTKVNKEIKIKEESIKSHYENILSKNKQNDILLNNIKIINKDIAYLDNKLSSNDKNDNIKKLKELKNQILEEKNIKIKKKKKKNKEKTKNMI